MSQTPNDYMARKLPLLHHSKSITFLVLFGQYDFINYTWYH